VGTAQVNQKIATDPRVIVLENTDIRNVSLAQPHGSSPAHPELVEGCSGSPNPVHPECSSKKNVSKGQGCYIPDVLDIITLDLSFISLTKIITQVAQLLHPGKILITLIKPQFEVGLETANKYKGIITDPDIQKNTVSSVTRAIEAAGFELQGVTESPILGGSGNKEFLAYFIKI
jgi:predicted rRNA methylase YqxC with S4 and FtsJ domains